MPGPYTVDDEVAAFVEANQWDVEDQDPTAWEGTGQALKGALRPSASAGRTLMMIGGIQPMVTDAIASAVSGKDITSGKDAYFKGVEEYGNSAVDYWTPDMVTMGGAARAVNTVTQVAGSLPLMIGAPEVFLADSMFSPATDLVNQGVDANTAINVGAANLAVNALGLKIPAAFGKTLPTRMATGAGANLGMGVAADVGSASALEAGGYEDQAAGYDWSDGNRRWLDGLMGAAFGFTAQVNAPEAPRYSRDASQTLATDKATDQANPAAPDAPGAMNIIEEPFGDATQHTAYVDGEKVGDMLLTDDGSVQGVSIRMGKRGQGLGVKLYTAMADKVIALGKAFKSDKSVSEAAARVWESLSRDFEVIKNPLATFDEASKTWLTPDGSPVYSTAGRKSPAPTASKVTLAQRDAILAARNANNFQDSAPGVPADGASKVANETLLSTSLTQLMAGERVSLSDAIPNEGISVYPRANAPATASRVTPQGDTATAIASAADELGIDPVDLATVISYETGGTFDPAQKGPTTQWGQHKGLIQFGEPQRAKYGVRDGMTVAEQMTAVVAYLKDTGVKPGMGILDVYSAINAGGVGRYGASDANNGGAPGTVADKVRDQMGGHRKRAEGMFVNARDAFTEGGEYVAVDKLQGGREYTNADRLLREGAAGTGPKRAPLDVRDNGDGTFAILDGNGTLSAARDMGWEEVPVRTTRAATARTTELAALTDIPETTRVALADHFEQAAAVKPRFDATVKSIAAEVGGIAKLSDIKGAERAAAKAVSDYAGDARKIKDLVRATINVETSGQADSAVAQAMAKINGKVKRNSLAEGSEPTSPVGYRDALIVGEIDGHPVELQVNFPEMLAAKKKAHKLYAEQSKIERELVPGTEGTPEQQAKIAELEAQQRAIYEPAWAATKERNAGSATNVALRENESAGNGRPAGTSQAVQAYPADRDTGTSSTSANRVPGGNDAGSSMLDMSVSSKGIVAETPVQAARRLSDETPDAVFMDFDSEGNPRYRSMSEVVAEIEAERQQATRDAEGIVAAVNCHIRRGDA